MRDKTPPHPSTRTIIAVSLAFATRSAKALLVTSTTLLLVALLAYSPKAIGDTASFSTKVSQVMVDTDRFGGCLAKVSDIPPQLSCKQTTSGAGWVAFGCDGSFGSLTKANKAFQQAQIAMLTQSTMAVWLDDNETTQEGFCHAYRSILSN
jgi:hypothetical protein